MIFEMFTCKYNKLLKERVYTDGNGVSTEYLFKFICQLGNPVLGLCPSDSLQRRQEEHDILMGQVANRTV